MAAVQTDNARSALRQELELIERFVGTYQKQLSGVIEQLNARPDAAVESRSLRLCVEAVNMMLSTHGQLATAIKRLAGSGTTRPTRRPTPPPESRQPAPHLAARQAA